MTTWHAEIGVSPKLIRCRASRRADDLAHVLFFFLQNQSVRLWQALNLDVASLGILVSAFALSQPTPFSYLLL